VKDSSSAATERVGRYQILDTIGSGPNGTVARAKVFGVAGFERQFAVKRFSPELTVQTAHAQALSAAARAYGGLEHPRIARMSEFGVASGTTFTAVEHVAGLDAMRLLTETKLAGVALAMGGALALVSQAARAVGYAHGRGLSHLGLSPTNVIVTIDGDVKVTDFGILAATMAPRPLDEPRLAQRIGYLAPEQLVAEATSAATDVFVLGVIACELVTGQRTYRGDTPQQIADAILAGPPPEPPLPRPIVRVLQRCLARSPFERFPDARALADALDAALRVAPVPGTRKDIGAQVKAIVDRLGELNEGNLSGMLSVNMPAQQMGRREMMDTQPSGEPVFRGHMDTEPSPTIGPAQLAAAASTIPEMPKAMTTVPGLAPPPIPVPPGVMTGGAPPPSPSGAPTMMGVPAVKRAIPSVPSQIPSIVKPGAKAPPAAPPPRTVDKAIEAITTLEPSTEIGPEMIAAANEPAPTASAPHLPAPPLFTPDRPRTPTPGQNFDSATGEMSQKQIKELNRRSIAPSGEFPPIKSPDDVQTTPAAKAHVEPADGRAATVPASPPPSAVAPPSPQMTLLGAAPPTLPARNTPMPSPPPVPPAVAELFANTPQPAEADTSASQDFFTPPPQDPPQPPMFAPEPAPPAPQMYTPAPYTPPPMDYVPPPAYPPPAGAGTTLPSSPPPVAYRSVKRASTAHVRKSKWPWVLFAVLLLGGIGTGGYFVYLQLYPEKPTNKVVMSNGSASAGSAGSAGSGAVAVESAGSGSAVVVATAPVDAAEAAPPPPAVDAAAVVATAPVDAAAVAAAPVDAGKQVATAAGTSDALEISSAPNGAHVYLDGADQGKTPVKLPGTADRHNVALLMAGHDLYVGEIDGHGKFNLELKPITPQAGPAGIKVIKCKDKERYYVFVDGKPTGMTCPTERINTGVGPHTVEVYDAVSESRQKWDINVKDTRLSFRVRIEEH
jgi:serine/threonine-protein kinase